MRVACLPAAWRGIPRVDPCANLACNAQLQPQAPDRCELLARHGDARSGRLWTAHSPNRHALLMPVGTYGAVKGLDPDDLRACGSQIILGNGSTSAIAPGPRGSPRSAACTA